VSEDEAKLLRKSGQFANIRAIQNGVDLEYFVPSENVKFANGADCVFVGALDYRANIDGVMWFCEHVWPQVRAVHPNATLQLIGRRPTALVNQLALLPGVEVIADVPDVRPYLHSAKLVIVPLRIARGIQNKVLEALAVGAAVVASPQAIEGLRVIPGEHVYLAGSTAEWVAAIDRLTNDWSECRRLGTASHEFVCQHHRWDRCLRPLEAFLQIPHVGFAGEPAQFPSEIDVAATAN
jgi:glycosyltransferase involved in cell wall biosynthesis